ncbi:MAG: patatin-like phospholipase family protein [Candidatus Rhabdochlamydia sp.]
MIAINKGNLSLAEKLITYDIGTRHRDHHNNSALHVVARQGYTELFQTFLRYFDIDTHNDKNKTPLHKAIKTYQLHIVKLFISKKLDVDSTIIYRGTQHASSLAHREFTITPAEYAMIHNDNECVDVLLKAMRSKTVSGQSFSLLSRSASQASFLHLVIHFHKNAMLKHLLSKHSDLCDQVLEMQDCHGNTPFSYAVVAENFEALSLLKIYEANIEHKNKLGHRPMHLAALSGNPRLVEKLYALNCQLSIHGSIETGVRELAHANTQALIRNLFSEREREITSPPNFSTKSPHNLVFKGGGPRGVAYVGALKALEERKALSQVTRVAGTSAGAINSTLLALNFTHAEMESILKGMDMMSFLDSPAIKTKITDVAKKVLNPLQWPQLIKYTNDILKCFLNPVPTMVNQVKGLFQQLWSLTGICEGEVFRIWIESQIRKKTGIEYCTFGELHQLIRISYPFKHLHIFATQINGKGAIVDFNSEDVQHANIIISDAVRASMSIPGAFKPHTMHIKKNGIRSEHLELGKFLDGGMIYNLPIDTFDREKYQQGGVIQNVQDRSKFNNQTLGFSFFHSSPELPKANSFDTVGDLLKALVDVYSNAEDLLRETNSFEHYRIINIDDQGVNLTSFNLSRERQNKLVQSGEAAVVNFYKKHEAEGFESLIQLKTSENLNSLSATLKGKASKLSSIQSTLEKHQSLLLKGVQRVETHELIAAFINKYRNSYSFIETLSYSNEVTKLEAYKNLARKLRISLPKDESQDKMISLIHQALENHQGKPWILIYDSHEATTTFTIPTRGGRVVIIPKVTIEPTIDPEALITVLDLTTISQQLIDLSVQDDENLKTNATLMMNELPQGMCSKLDISVGEYIFPIGGSKATFSLTLTPEGGFSDVVFQSLYSLFQKVLLAIPHNTDQVEVYIQDKQNMSELSKSIEQAFNQKQNFYVHVSSDGTEIDFQFITAVRGYCSIQ